MFLILLSVDSKVTYATENNKRLKFIKVEWQNFQILLT